MVAHATPRQFVFRYGSLVAQLNSVPTRALGREGFVTDLRDFRRSWGVAMNNGVNLPGYKYYVDEHGYRPEVYVAFLDVRPARGWSVNGVCTPVDRDQLVDLDERERNYVRVDVTAFVDLPGDQVCVWSYVGSPGGRRRLTTAQLAGRAVIDRDYLQCVLDAFKGLGPAEYEACAASLDPGDLPVVTLTRRAV